MRNKLFFGALWLAPGSEPGVGGARILAVDSKTIGSDLVGSGADEYSGSGSCFGGGLLCTV